MVLAILPESILSLLACLLFVIEPFVRKERKEWVGYFALFSLLCTALSLVPLCGRKVTAFSGMILLDDYALFFKALFLAISVLVICISIRYLKIERINLGEYYGLILFATVGMMLLPSATDLLLFYLALELMSVSFYVLIAFMRRDVKSVESGIKYFLTGVFTSGLILYGIAFLYGLSGTTHFGSILAYLSSQEIMNSPTLLFAIILLVAGFGFKIAAVPFHMWAPDVYEGAPTPITAYLSTGSKVAAFSAMLRLFMTGLEFSHGTWGRILWLIAVMTMTIGNVVALVQTNFKRLLAYSSIAHSGYILIGLIAASETGMAAVLIYTVAYALMTLGAFTIVILLCRPNLRGAEISDFKGLAKVHPAVAASFVLFALSLIGIPPTAGFIGKLFLFNAAIQGEFYWLAVIAVLNSVVSLYYYFKIIIAMYMQEPEEAMPPLSFSPALTLALLIISSATLLIGLYPEPLIEAALRSVQSVL